jgi:retinol-binding protein 3
MRNLVAVLLLSMCCGIPQAFATPPAIPDTPAGHTLQEWLDAFNSADEARVKAYCQKYDHPNPPEEMLDFSRRMGGFELVAVDQSQPLHIEFRVKEKASPRMGMGVIDVKDGDPVKITGFRLRPIPPGMSAADLQVKVDTAVRARVLDGIAAKLTEFYVFPDLAKKMVEALRAHQRKGEYDKVDNGYTFATLLTDQLQAVSHDKHLRVECVPKALPKEEEPP